MDEAPVTVAAGVGLDQTQWEADVLEFVTVDIISGIGETPDFAAIPLGTSQPSNRLDVQFPFSPMLLPP